MYLISLHYGRKKEMAYKQELWDDTMQGLLQAIEIDKENIPLTERSGMPAPTFSVSSDDKELVDKLIEIRKPFQDWKRKIIVQRIYPADSFGRGGDA